MKYVLMSHPEPTSKPYAMRVQERVEQLANVDHTVAAVQYRRIMQEEKEEDDDEPSYLRRKRAEALRNGATARPTTIADFIAKCCKSLHITCTPFGLTGCNC